MAHSYVTSFKSLDQLPSSPQKEVVLDKLAQVLEELGGPRTNQGELAAFLSFALGQPSGFTCLIDSYDTLESGLPNYLAVAVTMLTSKAGTPKAIRLDSGDLADLSIQCRQRIDKLADNLGMEALKDIKIVASDGLNERKVKACLEKGAKIDVYGIGTNLVTCEQ